MEAIRISTERAPAPGGWYSQAYKIGNLIYTAGVTANDPETQKMVAPGDIIGQTEQIMKNMQAILEEAGSDLAHIIKTMVFVKDIEDFAKFNEAYKKFFPNNPPARMNCTPFVRQYGILSNKWGVLLCQKEYQTNDIRRNSRSW